MTTEWRRKMTEFGATLLAVVVFLLLLFAAPIIEVLF